MYTGKSTRRGPFLMNKYESTTLGWVGWKTRKGNIKKSEDDGIDFPLEEISLAMYRKKKMEERKRKLPPEDGTKKAQSCRKKIKLGDDLDSSGKKKKDQKQHDIPDDVVSSGKKKN